MFRVSLLFFTTLFTSAHAAIVSFTSAPVQGTATVNYTHNVNNCQGTLSTWGPCTSSVTPTAPPFSVVSIPSLSYSLPLNIAINSATLFITKQTLSVTDIQNSWSSNGTVSGSTNYPQGVSLSNNLDTVTSTLQNATGLNGTSLNLLTNGFSADLAAQNAIAESIRLQLSLFAYGGWTGTSNFSFTQNRTYTDTSNYRAVLQVDYTELPEPATLLLSGAALIGLGLVRRRSALHS